MAERQAVKRVARLLLGRFVCLRCGLVAVGVCSYPFIVNIAEAKNGYEQEGDYDEREITSVETPQDACIRRWLGSFLFRHVTHNLITIPYTV